VDTCDSAMSALAMSGELVMRGTLDSVRHPPITCFSHGVIGNGVWEPRLDITVHCAPAVLKVTHLLQFTGPSTSQSAGRGCIDPFLCVVIFGQEPSWNSTQITEDYLSPGQAGLSEERVEVTGSCFLINPNSLLPR
jgi:hypothetical protein